MLFSALVWAAYLLAFALFAIPGLLELRAFADRVAFAMAAGLLLGLAGGANVAFNLHNHVHRPFFRSERANAWFERLTALTAGWPAFLWAHLHRTHHERVQAGDDWSSPRVRRDGRVESLTVFCLLGWPLRAFRHLKKDLESGRICDGARARAELKLFVYLWCVPALLGVEGLLGLWVLPHLVANLVVLPSLTYAAAAGARRSGGERSLTRANTFLGPVFDRLSFHWGLASTHYAWPQVHWSRLPRVHERERARMVDEGTHVLPYGAFQATEVLGGMLASAAGQLEFARTQARDYGTPIGVWSPPERTAAAEAAAAPERTPARERAA